MVRLASPRVLLASAALLTACGGSTAAPNPPPPPPPPPAPVVVASVEVTPPTGSLAAGDSLRLTATPKTAAGAAVSGKTVAWTTSAVSIATVSTTGMVSAVAEGSATITATVDGQSGTGAIEVTKGQVVVILDGGRSVSDSIGPAGGKLEVTSTAGVKYTLEIPAAALATVTRITMTPIERIAHLPLSGGLAGGADFQPTGLEFAVPATLTIATTATPGPNLRLIGFTYQATGDSLAPVGVKTDATSLTLPVRHFSGVGAGFGTTLDLQNLAGGFNTPGFASPSQAWISYLLQLAARDPRDFQSEFAAMRGWFNQTLLPQLQAVAQDFQLLRAIGEYTFWLQTTVALNTSGADPLFADLHDAWAQAVKPKLQAAIAGNNQECLAARSYTAVANALFWQGQGETFGAFSQLDRIVMLGGLCIKVILTDTSYPNPVTPGASHDLDLRAAAKFGNSAQLDNGPFSFTLRPSGSTNDAQVVGLSDALGRFTRVISPTTNTVLEVQVKACLHHSQVPYSDVCTNYRLQRMPGCGRIVDGNLTVSTVADLALAASVKQVTGSLFLGDGSVGAVDLPCLERAGAVAIASLQSPGTVRLSSLRSAESLTMSGKGLTSLDVPLLSQVENLTVGSENLRTLSLPNLTTTGGSFSISGRALETVTLRAVNNINVSIRGNPALRTITIGTFDAITVRLRDNPALQSLTTTRMTANTLEVFPNGLRGLSGVASATLIAFFFGVDDPLGEAAALAFANRITVTAGVCSWKVERVNFKCYTGPPWS